MQTIHTICRDCHGKGCETCNDAGYIELACFTVEEAKKILKHCGLEE